MAIYTNNNVKFQGITSPSIRTGARIGVNKYDIDQNGNIVGKTPIINIIDIDWNHATIEGENGLGPIDGIEDLLNIVNNVKNSVPTDIYQLDHSNSLLTLADIQALKPQLTGKSAYELAKESYETAYHTTFPYATVDSWVRSLKGETGERGYPGANGKSAFEIARSYYQSIGVNFPYANENEWIESVISGNDTKNYTDDKIISLRNELSTAIVNNATTLVETNTDNLEVKLVGTIQTAVNELGEEETTFKTPYRYQILLKNVATTSDIQSLQSQIESLASTDLVEQIDARINEIVNGATEAFDTFKEVEDWVNNLPLTPEEIATSIENIQTNIENLTGELKEEKTIDDGNGNISHIIDYKTYDKTGEYYAKSLEEVNEKINNLLNTVSVAKDVQDGAQENVIEAVVHQAQTFNINNTNVENHFLNVEKPEGSKTVVVGVNMELLNNIHNDIISKSVNQSKLYVDEKLSWKVQ